MSETTGHRIGGQWDRRRFLTTSLALAGGGLLYPVLAACGDNEGGGGGGTTSAAGTTSGGTSAEAPSSASSAAGASSVGGASSAASSAPASTSAAARKTASVRFNWTVKGEFTPFFVAREKGFYDDENIDIQLNEGKSGTQAVQVVGTGNDTFGYVPSIQVIQGINKQVPLKTVATVGQYTGMCWAAWPEVPLNGPDSLLGERVSISTSSTFFQVWPAFEKHFNLDASKITVVHPDPSARDGLFLSKKLDIMADIFYANDLVILEVHTDQAKALKAGEKLNVIRMSDLDFDPLGYMLIANNSVIDSDPDLVSRMVRATLKGVQYVIDNTDESISIMQKLYGDRLGNEVIDGQVKNMLTLLIKDPGIGHATDDMWNSSLSLLSDAGVIDKKLELTDYYTNDFLPS